MKSLAVIGFVLSVLVVGCGARRAEAVAYAKTHSVNLVEAARGLGSAPRLLSETEYPVEIRPLNPSKVAIGEHGVYVYINSSPFHVTGIFIKHDPKFLPPAPVPDSEEWGYEPVSTNVFWFSRPR